MDDLIKYNLEAYKYLFNIENHIRILILHQFKNDSDWWGDFKKRDVGETIKQIQNLEREKIDVIVNKKVNKFYKYEKNNFKFRHEIFYTHLEHLKKILFYYWEPHFKNIFNKDKNVLDKDFEILKNTRNYVMHNIQIQEDELLGLKSISTEIRKLISYEDIEIKKIFACYSYKEILNNFKNEFEKHKIIYEEDNYYNKISIDYFNHCTTQTWWTQDILKNINNKNTEKYYHNINEVNLMIKNEIDVVKIISEVENFQLEKSCKKLLNDLQIK